MLIQSRNRNFAGAPLERRHWCGDAYSTALYNALSTTFPRAERFFITTLRKFSDGVPDQLRREIQAFCQQEAVHSREHHLFNRALSGSDCDLSKLDARINMVIDRISKQPDIMQLCATMCIEHITAVMSRELIANPAHLAKADAEQRKLWLWHASEEVEHKGVAYDTWLHATQGWSRWRRWSTKATFMAKISMGFALNRSRGVVELLRQEGYSAPRAILGLAHYTLISPGMLRRTFPAWCEFFLPGFHPWNSDDRALINRAESEYAAAMPDAAVAVREHPKKAMVRNAA
ncbi:MAG: metal-dependent hydrolase [Parasphingorhabdus sp.]|nr:metal-dependent hydrolase [Parasphingorhabdus sp.]